MNYKTVAVVKNRTIEEIRALKDRGYNILGENRAQEFLRHYDELKDEGFTWHFVGQLQTNKVKYVVGRCELIHPLDRVSLAKEIDRIAKQRNIVQDCLIEVNMGCEESKGGIAPEKLGEFIKELKQFRNIRIRGLMSIMPIGAQENLYAELNRLFVRSARSLGVARDDKFEILSCGMSDDYKTAIKHGSNLIRLGRALFAGEDQQ